MSSALPVVVVNGLPFASKEVGCTTKLPGFGRPVNYRPEAGESDYIGDLLPNALCPISREEGTIHQPLMTLKEFEMLRLMDAMCSKSDWFLKIEREDVREKWKSEALADGRLSEAMVHWCIDEVRYRASKVSDPTNPPPVFVFHGDVYRSDNAVSPELKRELEEVVREFESKIPETKKDWHPGSNEQVWDLVHPSLFPLVYGRTRILPDGQKTTLEDCISRSGEGITIPVPLNKEIRDSRSMRHDPFSKNYQWLPCEVDISGTSSRITSYINNLHPIKEKRLYSVIEKLIDAAIPLWEHSLTPLETSFVSAARIPCNGPTYDKSIDTTSIERDLQQEPGEVNWRFEYRRDNLIKKARIQIPQPVGKFRPDPDEQEIINIKEKYGKTGLQVIVKLANIHLTPENPEYAGGSWHVEGQLNEHIVASALYYYSNENITQSTLSFRQQIEVEESSLNFDYEQCDVEWIEWIFGCKNEDKAVQMIGGVKTEEGRMVSFPNVLQHHVDAFRLLDPSKPGHRKIVALFLVDPRLKIISTANVPCQRKDWWWENVLDQLARDERSAEHQAPKGLLDLPSELRTVVENAVPDDLPYGIGQAEDIRLDLMSERGIMDETQGQEFEGTGFSLCEH